MGGDREAKAGGDWTGDVGASRKARAEKDLDEAVQGWSEIEAVEPAAVHSREHVVEADRFTLVVGGKRILSLQSSGVVVLSGTSVTVNGKMIALAGASIAKSGPAAAAAQQAKVAEAEKIRAARALAMFVLVDLDGQPIPRQAFELTPTSDGVVRKGRTSDDGKVMMPIDGGEYELVFPEQEGEEGKEKDPKRGERARKDGQRIGRGKKLRLTSDKVQVLELPERVGMTIAFLFEPGRESEYPKFVLESDDGAYRQELSLKDDLVKGDKFVQLRFTGMMAGRTYQLSVTHDGEHYEPVYSGVPYEQLVDQPRPNLPPLEDRRLTLREMDAVSFSIEHEQ